MNFKRIAFRVSLIPILKFKAGYIHIRRFISKKKTLRKYLIDPFLILLDQFRIKK